MRFVESKGAVKVTVRTGDNQLAQAIASELPKFERGLESRGWSSEFQTPNHTRDVKPLEDITMANRERVQTEVQLSAIDLAQSEQDPTRRHKTDWEDEFEDRTTAAALRRLSISGEER